MIREHLRSNVVGYVALFCFAMSGTAVALDGSDTVFSDDIVDGQVKTNDISDSNGVRSADVRDDTLAGGGLTAEDLGPNSVAASEIAPCPSAPWVPRRLRRKRPAADRRRRSPNESVAGSRTRASAVATSPSTRWASRSSTTTLSAHATSSSSTSMRGPRSSSRTARRTTAPTGWRPGRELSAHGEDGLGLARLGRDQRPQRDLRGQRSGDRPLRRRHGEDHRRLRRRRRVGNSAIFHTVATCLGP